MCFPFCLLVFGFIRQAGLSGPEAEEVAQEVFISVAGEMPDFRYDPARGSFKSWLLTIVRRLVDFWRQRGRRMRGVSLEALTESGDGAEPAHEAELESLWQTEWDRHLLDQACLRVRRNACLTHGAAGKIPARWNCSKSSFTPPRPIRTAVMRRPVLSWPIWRLWPTAPPCAGLGNCASASRRPKKHRSRPPSPLPWEVPDCGCGKNAP